MIQREFAEKVINIVKNDPLVAGLAVTGSWKDNEIDEYSDLDLILVTFEKISGSKDKMLQYALSFGDLLNGFTGDHVGEPRVFICLYDNPFLHVDIKFIDLEEFRSRIENPEILFERDNLLSKIINETTSKRAELDLQWIEDRFWIWIHYAACKIGRGEYFEALDFLSYLRATVISPLLQKKNGLVARGVRKVEMQLKEEELQDLKSTLADYNPESMFKAIKNSIEIYKKLRRELFPPEIKLNIGTEKRSLEYLEEIKCKMDAIPSPHSRE